MSPERADFVLPGLAHSSALIARQAYLISFRRGGQCITLASQPVTAATSKNEGVHPCLAAVLVGVGMQGASPKLNHLRRPAKMAYPQTMSAQSKSCLPVICKTGGATKDAFRNSINGCEQLSCATCQLLHAGVGINWDRL